MKNRKILIPAMSAVATATVAAPLILSLSSCGSKWSGDDVREEYIPKFKPLTYEDPNQKLNLVEGNDLWFDAYKGNHSIPNEEYKWSSSGISWLFNELSDWLYDLVGQKYRPLKLTKYNAKLYDFRINSEEVKNGQKIRRVSYRAVNDMELDLRFKMPDSANDLEFKEVHGSIRFGWSHTVNNMPFGLFDVGTDNLQIFNPDDPTRLGDKPFQNQTLWFFGPDMSKVENEDKSWSLDLDIITGGDIYLNDDKLINLDNEFQFTLDEWTSYAIELITKLLVDKEGLNSKLGLAIGWQVERLIPMLAGWNSYYLSKVDHYDHINSHQDDEEETVYGWKTQTTKTPEGFVVADTSWSSPAMIRYELGEKGFYTKGDGDIIDPEIETPDIFCVPILVRKQPINREKEPSILDQIPKISIPDQLTATSYVSNDGDRLSVYFDWNKEYWLDSEDGRPEDGFSFSHRYIPEKTPEIIPVTPDIKGSAKNSAQSIDGAAKQKQLAIDGMIIPLVITQDWMAIGRPFDLQERKNIRLDRDPNQQVVNTFDALQDEDVAKGEIKLRISDDVYQIFKKFEYSKDDESFPFTSMELNLSAEPTKDEATMEIPLTEGGSGKDYVDWRIDGPAEHEDDESYDGSCYLYLPFVSTDLIASTNQITSPYSLVITYEDPATGEEVNCVAGTGIRAVMASSNRWIATKAKTIFISGSTSNEATYIENTLEIPEYDPSSPTDYTIAIISEDGTELTDLNPDKHLFDAQLIGGSEGKPILAIAPVVEKWNRISGLSNCRIKIQKGTFVEGEKVLWVDGVDFINPDPSLANLVVGDGFSGDIIVNPNEPTQVGTFAEITKTIPSGGEFKTVVMDGEHNIVWNLNANAVEDENDTDILENVNIEFNTQAKAVSAAKCTLVLSYTYTDWDGTKKTIYGSTNEAFNILPPETPVEKSEAQWYSTVDHNQLWPDKRIVWDGSIDPITSPCQILLSDASHAATSGYKVSSLVATTPMGVKLDLIRDGCMQVRINPNADGFLDLTLTPNTKFYEVLKASTSLVCTLSFNWQVKLGDGLSMTYSAQIPDIVFIPSQWC